MLDWRRVSIHSCVRSVPCIILWCDGILLIICILSLHHQKQVLRWITHVPYLYLKVHLPLMQRKCGKNWNLERSWFAHCCWLGPMGWFDCTVIYTSIGWSACTWCHTRLHQVFDGFCMHIGPTDVVIVYRLEIQIHNLHYIWWWSVLLNHCLQFYILMFPPLWPESLLNIP